MRATNLMYRSYKEKTPDPYDYQVLADGKSLCFASIQKCTKSSFSKSPRFSAYNVTLLFLMLFQDRVTWSSTNVGPGSYQVENRYNALKKRSFMAKIKQPSLQEEGCYDVINNTKVLQPKYLKKDQKKVLEQVLSEMKKDKKFKRINESYVFQKLQTVSVKPMQMPKRG